VLFAGAVCYYCFFGAAVLFITVFSATVMFLLLFRADGLDLLFLVGFFNVFYCVFLCFW